MNSKSCNSLVFWKIPVMMQVSCNVEVLHELPLPIVTKAFSTTNVFKILNCYQIII